MIGREKCMEKKNIFFVEAAAVCHMGRVRMNNEDNLYFSEKYLPMEHIGTEKSQTMMFQTDQPEAFGVFDGMGGEANGELASYIAAKEFAEVIQFDEITPTYLTSFFNDLNRVICEMARNKHIVQMGTTASVVIFKEDKAIVTNLGDSPIFLFRDGQMRRIFKPHTNEELLKANNIHRKPALTQFLGLDHDGMLLEPYYYEFEVLAGDLILVASDGLTDMLTDMDIRNIVNNSSLSVEERMNNLLNQTLEKGAVDNTTIILSEVSKEGASESVKERRASCQKKRKTSSKLLGGIILLVVLAVGSFGFYFMGQKSGKGIDTDVNRLERFTPAPKSINSSKKKLIRVPNLVEKDSWQDAVKALNKKKLLYRIQLKKAKKNQVGRVLEQNIKANEKVAADTIIIFTVGISDGKGENSEK